jgi:PAS domain S-box-containing protein
MPAHRQAIKLVGALYKENNLTPLAFTSDHVTVLKLLDSQATIFLENAILYSELQRREAFLAEAESISHTGSFGWSVRTGEIYWSEETYDIFEHDRAAKPTFELILQRTYPDDRDLVEQTLDGARQASADFDLEHRLLMPDGRVKHVHVLARAVKTSSDNLEFVGAVADVTTTKQVEEKIGQIERELRKLLDLSPQLITEFGPNGSPLYSNQAAREYHGLTLEEWQSTDLNRLVHPQDVERMTREARCKFVSASPYEIEVRLKRRDGQYRWSLFRFKPMLDEQGRLTRWYAAATDIQDRKQAEQRFQNENVALQRETGNPLIFAEIVLTSPR